MRLLQEFDDMLFDMTSRKPAVPVPWLAVLLGLGIWSVVVGVVLAIVWWT